MRIDKLSILREKLQELDKLREKVASLQEEIWALEKDYDLQTQLMDELAEYESSQSDYIEEEEEYEQ